jgi:hypothetical protein
VWNVSRGFEMGDRRFAELFEGVESVKRRWRRAWVGVAVGAGVLVVGGVVGAACGGRRGKVAGETLLQQSSFD